MARISVAQHFQQLWVLMKSGGDLALWSVGSGTQSSVCETCLGPRFGTLSIRGEVAGLCPVPFPSCCFTGIRMVDCLPDDNAREMREYIAQRLGMPRVARFVRHREENRDRRNLVVATSHDGGPSGTPWCR